jgi:hypothetical protein
VQTFHVRDAESKLHAGLLFAVLMIFGAVLVFIL